MLLFLTVFTDALRLSVVLVREILRELSWVLGYDVLVVVFEFDHAVHTFD